MNVKSSAVLTLAASACLVLVAPSQGQRARASRADRADAQKIQAKLHALQNLDARSMRRDGSFGSFSDEGGIAGAPFQNWSFENPPFATGPVNNQNTWLAFTGGAPCAATPNTNTPVVSTAGPALGGAQWINIAKGPCTNGSSNGPFGPTTNQSAGQFTASCRVRINDVEGADYDCLFQAPSIGNLVARVKFSFTGDIMVATDADGPGPAGAVFTDSGVNYVQGQAHLVTIEVDGPGNSLKYYIDGALVNSGQLIHRIPTGLPPVPSDRIEQFALLCDNFQNNLVDFGQVDDVVIEPGIGPGDCFGDTDGDNDVDADDLTAVILQWGNTCPCTGDVDNDNDVDSDDLVTVVLNWGSC